MAEITVKLIYANTSPGMYGLERVDPTTPGAIVCGECGRAWADDITPAGRCPWEYDASAHPSGGIRYTDAARVLEVDTGAAPTSGRPVSGYGRRIPTAHRVRYIGADGVARWHRVRAMIYGNSGAPYISAGGHVLHLDNDTEHRLTREG